MDTSILLEAHSGWRWVVLVLMVITALKALFGWLGGQKWHKSDANLVRYTQIAAYIQVVLGIILYIALKKWTNMQFTGEHVIVAILAVGGIEFGAGRSKKARGRQKFMFVFIGFAIALLLILVAIGTATQWRFV